MFIGASFERGGGGDGVILVQPGVVRSHEILSQRVRPKHL